ncbi:MAG: lipid-A-disaccharide synthase [Myxococcota bacterium]
MTDVLMSVGDASGDLHAAEWVRALRARQPGLDFAGMGGPAMQDAGVERLVDQRELAVGGVLELAGSASRIRRAWRTLDRALVERRPRLVVLVDSGAFNIPFARRVRRRSRARILYYVAPQVWAWRRRRVHKLARRVDRLAAILPFEPPVYEGTGLPVDFVGHPLVDPLSALRESLKPAEALASLCLEVDRPWVAVLPGSRRNEIDHHLPVQLETIRRLHARDPRLGFAIAVAPSIDAADLERAIERSRLPSGASVRLVCGQTRSLLRGARVALAKPGTGLLEAALLETPMVVLGRAHPWTAAFVRRAIRVPSLAMPNLVAGRGVVPELIQEQATPDALAEEVLALLDGPARDRQLRDLAEVRERLGHGGAAERAAAIAEAMLERV